MSNLTITGQATYAVKPKSKRRKIIHACACCGTQFPSRKACWAHLDAGCPKRTEQK